MNNSSSLYVVSMENTYRTLRAGKIFSVGDTVLDLLNAEERPAPDYSTIDLGDKHVYHPIGRYINHSCDPNTYVDAIQKKITALKIINIGDDITFDYLATERQIVAPFDCNCASDNCVGRVEKCLITGVEIQRGKNTLLSKRLSNIS